ncbi:MAG: FkbM family methyltransferase [Candidatus Magasanikbacteria bacterium]|nr:FkbM family methyltransferase [Candidatus Magasanikbacteria bacterium]
MDTNQRQFGTSRPPWLLYVFLKFYLLLRKIGVTKLPHIKGMFYYIYSRIKNKTGIMEVLTIDGIRLSIDLADDIIATKLLQYGYWEKGLTILVKKLIKPGMTVIDVGAHVGYYSTLFSSLVGSSGRVIAFEPEPYNLSLLKKNMTANHCEQCLIEPVALSDANGTVTLYLDSVNRGAHSMINYGLSKQGVAIKAIRLDEYIQSKRQSIDFIKMDIEGNESFALSGAIETIRSSPNLVMVLEFCPTFLRRSSQDPEAFLVKIASYGFFISVIDHDSGALKTFANNADIIQACGTGLVNLLCSRNAL